MIIILIKKEKMLVLSLKKQKERLSIKKTKTLKISILSIYNLITY